MAGVVCHRGTPEIVGEDVPVADGVSGDITVQLNRADIVVNEVTVNRVDVG